MRRLVLTLISLGASAAFLWLAFRDLSGVTEAFASARFWPWVPLAILLYLGGHVVRGLRCRKLVSNDADLHLATATNIVVMGYGVNNILPARLGEVARALLLSERIGMPVPQSLTVTLLERVLDGWAILLLFLAGVALVPQMEGMVVPRVYPALLIFGIASVGMGLMLCFPYGIAAAASRFGGLVRESWQDPLWRFFVHVANGLSYLRRPTHALRLVGLSFGVWILEAGMYFVMLRAFGLPLKFEWAVVAMAMTNLGLLVPSLRGHVGVFHALCTKALVVLGVSTVTAAAYAIAVHAVFYIPITIWGIGVVLRYGIEIGWRTARARDARRPAASTVIDGVPVMMIGTSRERERRTTPTRLIVAITEALLADQAPRDAAGPPAEVTGRVATFVQGQVNALPTLLRILLLVGLVGFRVLVRLRYVRSFCSLPLATRRSIVNAWAYGRYAVTRQLFRVLRSIALLSYYEDVGVTGSTAVGSKAEHRAPREVAS